MLDNDMIVLNPSNPTSKKSTNIIDLVTSSSKIADNINEVEVDTSLDYSDHFIVRFNLCFSKKIAFRDKINWLGVTESASKYFGNLRPILDDQDAEFFADNFSKKCVDIISSHTKEVPINKHEIKIPTHIKDLIETKKRSIAMK